METRQHPNFGQVIAFKNAHDQIVGFHARNLETAQLSVEAWESLKSEGPTVIESVDAKIALKDWHLRESGETTSDTAFAYINSININVTQVCNLKCLYCEAGGDGSYGRAEKKIILTKAVPALEKMLSRIPNSGEFTVTFVGGEPLLYPEGMRILAEYCHEQTRARGIDLQFRVVTNGTLISEDILTLLAEYRMHVVVSLDGPDEIQDRLRPTAGGGRSSAKVTQALNLLSLRKSELGSVALRAIFGRHNTDVKTVYHHFKKWDFTWYEFNFDVALSEPGLSLEFQESLSQLANEIFATGGEDALRKIKFYDRVFDRLDRRVRVESFCDSGKSFAVIDAQGSIFKCPWETNIASKATGNSADFEFSQLQDIEMSLIETNNCGKCWARHLCGGGCMYAHGLATGSKTSPDRVYCQRTRSLLSEAIMFYSSSREVTHENSY